MSKQLSLQMYGQPSKFWDCFSVSPEWHKKKGWGGVAMTPDRWDLKNSLKMHAYSQVIQILLSLKTTEVKVVIQM